MSLIIPTRIFLILLLILIAYTGGNPFDIEWTKITGGVCEEFSGAKCLKGTGIREVNVFEPMFNITTLIFVWGITIFGAWFKGGNLIAKLERGSHLSKDAGELAGALGAIMVFTLPLMKHSFQKRLV